MICLFMTGAQEKCNVQLTNVRAYFYLEDFILISRHCIPSVPLPSAFCLSVQLRLLSFEAKRRIQLNLQPSAALRQRLRVRQLLRTGA